MPAIHRTWIAGLAKPAIALTFASGLTSTKTGTKLILVKRSGGDGNGATSCVEGIAELAHLELRSLILGLSNASGQYVIESPTVSLPSSNLSLAYIKVVMGFIVSNLGRLIASLLLVGRTWSIDGGCPGSSVTSSCCISSHADGNAVAVQLGIAELLREMSYTTGSMQPSPALMRTGGCLDSISRNRHFQLFIIHIAANRTRDVLDFLV